MGKLSRGGAEGSLVLRGWTDQLPTGEIRQAATYLEREAPDSFT